MPFERNWDSSCPIVWDQWEDGGVTWVIRDLRPEDDEEALRILEEHQCTDETLCTLSKLAEDKECLEILKPFWLHFLQQRMSLGCYEEKDGQSKLVGLNACVAICKGERLKDEIVCKSYRNVCGALEFAEEKVDAFEYLGTDVILGGVGLVVSREYRGLGLATRILKAREPLCLHNGIKGTATVFTGLASQKSALKAGFTSVATVTLKELADAGLDYPADETRNIQLMMKKFDCNPIDK